MPNSEKKTRWLAYRNANNLHYQCPSAHQATTFCLWQLLASAVRTLQQNGRDWHLTDKPAAPDFVGYWSNSGHCPIFREEGSVANDPKRTS
jgi:hypothetical protein